MKYIPVIGLEIHAELLTKTKIFCSCENGFGGEPNTRVCPVCSAMPGTLPVLNREVVTKAIQSGIILGCKINNNSTFERKNYFYPDLPKAYQITQMSKPVCSNGLVEIGDSKIRINRIQIEEDAGKLIHDGTKNISSVDFNRCGVPLIEIVTEPDFSSADEVCEFVREVALRLRYAGVCNSKLEEGSIRVDVNISLKTLNSFKKGIRAEIKNLNSLKSIKRAIEYEIKRQSELLDNGNEVKKETRRFDENLEKTFFMRLKEEASQYRFFPEPDIPPLFITEDEINTIRKNIPLMPNELKKKYIDEYKLSCEDAELIISNKEFCDFYEEVIKIFSENNTVAKFMLTEVNRNLNDFDIRIQDACITPKDVAELLIMISQKQITHNAAKEILKIMFKTGDKPEKIAIDERLITTDNWDEFLKVAKQVLEDNKENVEDYKNGNEKLFGYFIGQILRKLPKSADPQIVRQILTDLLK